MSLLFPVSLLSIRGHATIPSYASLHAQRLIGTVLEARVPKAVLMRGARLVAIASLYRSGWMLAGG